MAANTISLTEADIHLQNLVGLPEGSTFNGAQTLGKPLPVPGVARFLGMLRSGLRIHGEEKKASLSINLASNYQKTRKARERHVDI